ncbi:MAG: glycine cleavage T C-terminal barrel domain-containing protein, partial [Pseudomonadota bacterium]
GLAPCIVGRVSFTGDLGYEIWMRPEYQRHVYDRLVDAGAKHGLRHFGLRALNALRLEKNWGGWGREYRPIYGPLEAGLDRFVAYEKEADFVGKAGALAERETGGALRLCGFTVEARDADVIGDEPIFYDGSVVGWVTSGGFAHNAGLSMALGYVPKEHANTESGWAIEVLGEMLPARRQFAPVFDANAERMRG